MGASDVYLRPTTPRATAGRSSGPVASPRGVGLTTTSWEPESDLGLRDWLLHGRRLGALGRGIGWWIGDWLTYGNARYGERYARAARVTGYDSQSLMNMVYVASRFSVERRRSTLSWSHHAEVAALAVEEQERWLDLAEQERMSVRSLRAELQARRRAQRRADGMLALHAEHDAPSSSVMCPHCRGIIELGAAHPDGPDATVPARPMRTREGSPC